ncbi:MAG: class I SAM-dependent methyltransferase [Solirubrobacteraceae bacterium]|nr:class I SAM-dependent methyltransferase [Solirubrobacteraceae bacterium]
MASDALDWGDGTYELFSPALRPAAERLLEQAAPQPGERAIDLGSGDGNATLPLARSGATVTAVEPAPRLLGVTAQRLAVAGFSDATTIEAPAEALPLPDGSADLIVSNFAVIFSEEPEQAAREVLRVLAPGGRFLYTAWRTAGPLAEVSMAMRRAVAEAPANPAGDDDGGFGRGIPDESPGGEAPPRWDEPDFLAALVPGGAAAITSSEEFVDFTASSPDAWVDAMFADQPAWRAAKRAVDPERWPETEAEIREILRSGSLEPDRLVLRSPYVLVEVQPHA